MIYILVAYSKLVSLFVLFLAYDGPGGAFYIFRQTFLQMILRVSLFRCSHVFSVV